jgi:hypothetical protein
LWKRAGSAERQVAEYKNMATDAAPFFVTAAEALLNERIAQLWKEYCSPPI